MINKNIDIQHEKIKVAFSNTLDNKNIKFKVSYLGRIKESKGINVLIESIKFLPNNIEIFIAGEPDIEYDINKLNNLNTDIGFLSEEKMDKYFKESDLIVLPYTKSYEHGHSSLLPQACQYNKKVIVPDFFPFNEIIKKFSIGELFEAENPKSLADTIINCSKNDYLEYLKNNDLYDLIKEILNDLY